jgi:hypothetical protein
VIASKHLEFIVVLLASLLAIYVGSHIVALSIPELAVVGSAILVAVWALTAGDYWWVPILAGVSIGGKFYVGFKVYPMEVAFALAVLGLVPLILVQGEKAAQRHRKPVPFIFYIVFCYVSIRLLIDIVPADAQKGSLARLLFGDVAPLGLAFLFHAFGKISAVRAAIGVMFILLLMRTFAALVGYFTGIPLYIPGINYVLSVAEGDSLLAMRNVAFALFLCALIFFHSSRSSFNKALLIPVFIFAAVMTTMGQGRFATLFMMTLPAAFFLWSRQWVLLFFVFVLGSGLVAFINVFPQSLASLPPGAGRALSGLVVTSDVSRTDFSTASSDDWHSGLKAEGFKRWTSSPLCFLFGEGITPSPDLADTKTFTEDPVSMIQNAANVGAYECGLWTTLGELGTVGFVLYLLLFISLWKQTLPYFFRRPKGTFGEGVLFMGCYSSLVWFIACYFQGGVPSMEVIFLVMAWDVIQDGKLDETVEQQSKPEISYRAPSPRLGNALPVRSRV